MGHRLREIQPFLYRYWIGGSFFARILYIYTIVTSLKVVYYLHLQALPRDIKTITALFLTMW